MALVWPQQDFSDGQTNEQSLMVPETSRARWPIMATRGAAGTAPRRALSAS